MSNEYKDWIDDLKNSPEGTPDHNRTFFAMTMDPVNFY